MEKGKTFAKNLINFIDNSPSPFHAVNQVKELLLENGFKELKLEDRWNLEKEGKYYVVKNDSAIISFVIGKGNIEEDGFKLVGAHTDAPTLKIKPSPEIVVDNRYLK